jgi:hypothetical protein
LANQTIEGGKGGAGKLGMKEILQLFRRDVEHAPPQGDSAAYDLGMKPRILKEGLASPVKGGSRSPSKSGGSWSREPSVQRDREKEKEKKITPSMLSSRKVEDSVYGRRW